MSRPKRLRRRKKAANPPVKTLCENSRSSGVQLWNQNAIRVKPDDRLVEGGIKQNSDKFSHPTEGGRSPLIATHAPTQRYADQKQRVIQTAGQSSRRSFRTNTATSLGKREEQTLDRFRGAASSNILHHHMTKIPKKRKKKRKTDSKALFIPFSAAANLLFPNQ